jgi:hypothetical protein
MSHWQVTAVANAFSLQEKSGRGLENMTCKGYTHRIITLNTKHNNIAVFTGT